jgi:hypothetical protein
VLFLRSFGSDTASVNLWNQCRRILSSNYETCEESLAVSVQSVGPLVAIGRPGEWLPPLGATRLYVRQNWEQVVAELVAVSQLVVLRIGRTAGLWWEFEHLLTHCDPLMVLIYLPKTDRRAIYDEFRTRTRGLLPHPLPETPGQALFLGFDAEWVPRLLGERGPSVAARLCHWLAGASAPASREALRETLSRAGVRVHRFRLSCAEWGRLLVVTPLLICFYLGWASNAWQDLREFAYEHTYIKTPRVYVVAEVAGMSPREMEVRVATELEMLLSRFPGVSSAESISRWGECVVALELDGKEDADEVSRQAQNALAIKIESLRASVPGLSVHVIPQSDEGLSLILLESDSGISDLPSLDSCGLQDLADEWIKPALMKTKCVASVAPSPLHDSSKRYWIRINPDRMAAYGVTISEIFSALRPQMGRMRRNFARDTELEEVTLRVNDEGQLLRLRDIATVDSMCRPNICYRRCDGHNITAIAVSFALKPGLEMSDIADTLVDLGTQSPHHVRLTAWRARAHEPVILLRPPTSDSRHRDYYVTRAALYVLLEAPEMPDGLGGIVWAEDQAFVLRERGHDSLLDHGSQAQIGQMRELLTAQQRTVGMYMRHVHALRMLWPGEGAQIRMEVTGSALAELRRVAATAAERISSLPGVVDVDIGSTGDTIVTKVDVDKSRSRDFLEFDADEIEVLSRLVGSGELTIPWLFCDNCSVVLQADHFERRERQRETMNLLRLHTRSRNVSFGEIARLSYEPEPREIHRRNGAYCVTISCNAAEGWPWELRRQVRRIAAEISNKTVNVEVR